MIAEPPMPEAAMPVTVHHAPDPSGPRARIASRVARSSASPGALDAG